MIKLNPATVASSGGGGSGDVPDPLTIGTVNATTITATDITGLNVTASGGTLSAETASLGDVTFNSLTGHYIYGNVADGANTAVKIGNVNALTNSSAKIVGFYPDETLTEKSYIDKDGAYHGAVVGAVTGNVTGNLTGNVTATTLSGTLTGNVTGDVTGNMSGTTAVASTSVTTPLTVAPSTTTLTLRGRAADGGTGVVIDNGTTLTSGTIVNVKNNGTSKLTVDYAGALSSGAITCTALTVNGVSITANGGITEPVTFAQVASSSVASGSNAFALTSGAKIALGSSGSTISQVAATKTVTVTSAASDGASAIGTIINTTADLTTSGAKRVSFQSAGTEYAFLDSGGHFVPGSDNAHTLGRNASNQRWSQLHLSTHAYGPDGNPKLVTQSSDWTGIVGSATDGSTAVGMKFYNVNALTTSGAKIAAFYSNNNSTNRFSLYADGKLGFEYTNDTVSGARTINKPSGQSIIAAGASSVVITNSSCVANSTVIISPMSLDATAKEFSWSASAGSFTVTVSANATADWKFGWLVINH